MGVWQRATVLMSILCIQSETEDAHQSALGAYAQRENQIGNEQWHSSGQYKRRSTTEFECNRLMSCKMKKKKHSDMCWDKPKCVS